MARICVTGIIHLTILCCLDSTEQTHFKSAHEDSIISAPGTSNPGESMIIHYHPSSNSVNISGTRDTVTLKNLRAPSDNLRVEDDVEDIEDDMNLNKRLYSVALEPLSDNALNASKLDIDENHIELKLGKYYRNILSSRSKSILGMDESVPRINFTVQASGPRHHLFSGKKFRILPMRQGRYESLTMSNQTLHLQNEDGHDAKDTSSHRHANPDIQDIITGIVKLLNGKVNVAVNSAKPHRPIHSTRINNRGPPRISDLPPAPSHVDSMDLPPPPPLPPEQPSLYEKPPKVNTPSLNQRPPNFPMSPFGVPLPEGMFPPNIRPLNRPPFLLTPGLRLQQGSRRPGVPLNYKPMTKYNGSMVPDQYDYNTVNSVLDGSSVTINRIDQHSKKLSNDTLGIIQSNAVKLESSSQNVKSLLTLDTENRASNDTLVLGGSAARPMPISTTPYRLIENSSIASNETLSSSQNVEPMSVVPLTDSKMIILTDLDMLTSLKTGTAETTTKDSSLGSKKSNEFPNGTEVSSIISQLDPSTPMNFGRETSSTATERLATSWPSSIGTSGAPDDFIASTTDFITSKDATQPYRPRPGIVLDDTLDYVGNQGLTTHRPYAVPPSRYLTSVDTFDVVVSAIQGPGKADEGFGLTVSGSHDIMTSPVEGQGFVSIDGKRTYLNLFDNTEKQAGISKVQVYPSKAQTPGIAHVTVTDNSAQSTRLIIAPARKPSFHRRSTQPPVRIDTCIVGDSSTCDLSQHEACATVHSVSACHCKPGFARASPSLPCKKIVSIVVAMKVDKIYDRKIIWVKGLADRDSELYQTLAYEANRAIESAISMTPFSDEYVSSSINNVFQGDISQGLGGIFVNTTLKLAHEHRTMRPSLAAELQKQLLGVIQRRYNNIGNSALHVDSPVGSISNIQDLDECSSPELNDCHAMAVCTNNWGGFICSCNSGLRDPRRGDHLDSGRTCLPCPSSHCNNRGTCAYQNDDLRRCTCIGNYYGAQCEIDGEVLGVSIAASVGALMIILLTLVCLISWTKKWQREQKALSPFYGYIQSGIPGTLTARVGSIAGTVHPVKQGPATLPPYVWAHQVADHLANANVYATEPVGLTRPNSFGYPTLSVTGSLPPIPLPRFQAPSRVRLRAAHLGELESSDSEPQDKDRTDLIPQSSTQMPRPKSRSSLTNQSGIYYDVEYDQSDARHLSKNHIPMSTYSMAPYYRT